MRSPWDIRGQAQRSSLESSKEEEEEGEAVDQPSAPCAQTELLCGTN